MADLSQYGTVASAPPPAVDLSQYGDVSPAPATPSSQQGPGPVAKYFGALGEGFTGIPQATIPQPAAPTPAEPTLGETLKQNVPLLFPQWTAAKMLGNYARQLYEYGSKAKQSLVTGQPGQTLPERATEAAGYAAAGALPFLGPVAAKAGEEYAAGAPAEASGHATAALLQAVAPTVVGKPLEVVSDAFKADPVVAMVKALRPTPSQEGFVERLPDALSNIKAANFDPATGTPREIRTNSDLISSSQRAIFKHQNSLEQWMAPARRMNVPVSGDSIVQATRDSIPSTMWQENPQAAQAIVDEAQQAYGDKTFNVDQMRQFLKEKNADANAFYSKSTAKQQAAITSGKPEAVVKAQRDAVADSLYKALDPANNGAGPRQIQLETGDMIDVLDAAQRRKNAIIGEQPTSTAEALGQTLGNVVSLPGRAVLGEGGGPLSSFGRAWHGTSEPLIRRAFAAVGPPRPVPLPAPTNVRGLLGAGPIITPDPNAYSGAYGGPRINVTTTVDPLGLNTAKQATNVDPFAPKADVLGTTFQPQRPPDQFVNPDPLGMMHHVAPPTSPFYRIDPLGRPFPVQVPPTARTSPGAMPAPGKAAKSQAAALADDVLAASRPTTQPPPKRKTPTEK
jgi:hypothetical protein